MSQRTNSLMDKLKNVRRQTGIDTQILLKKYFIDCLLELISQSDYSSNFIWKGGFILSSIAGIARRTTIDVDSVFRKAELTQAGIKEIFEEITFDKEIRGVSFEIAAINQIMEEKVYPGFRIFIIAKLENIKDRFHLDVSTGEKIFPPAVRYTYQPTIAKDPSFELFVYSTERMLAEKLQTILVRGTVNTRSKDFYDIWLISQLEVIDVPLFVETFHAVIVERKSLNDFEGWEEILEDVQESVILLNRWDKYCKENQYVGSVSFLDTLEKVRKWFVLVSERME